MASPRARKSNVINRLKKKLNDGKESLADQFEFKMFVAFVFKDKHKKSALFEVSRVVSVMTNDYEKSILKGAEDNIYSMDSSVQLLEKDMVQFHAPQYCSLRKDVVGCTRDMDFILWPRNDLERVTCFLFSRWKGDSEAEFQHIEATFQNNVEDYEKQILHIREKNMRKNLIVSNPAQSMFLFLDHQYWQSRDSTLSLFKVSNICLYLPQDHLTRWSSKTMTQVLQPYLPD
ncbi:uncharacterized protein C6orf62 homolog [Dendronephthya gigantea]|uniref:uncharacterized protein C6orf62 homolog n=1 Tax=Dendronephthya gigantea TaxID=151771 RepID=UPI00106BBCBE|nr:uncharacterized protein C6orf62 homolog [Dendronephthya gigantea]XP_028417776.1 uncharacterized protein C6orf62 homolog [Dendronephthya gigantea]